MKSLNAMILSWLPVLLLVACGGDFTGEAGREEDAAATAADDASDPRTGEAVLRRPDGDVAGMAVLTERDEGVLLEVQISLLPSGEHGFHVHETGSCEPPDFESAGGHFNPTDEDHGVDGAEGSHIGDMQNLIVEADGTARTFRTIEGAHLADGPRSLLREGGTAIVIHARPDDYTTDPSGASGPRIACGVVEPV